MKEDYEKATQYGRKIRLELKILQALLTRRNEEVTYLKSAISDLEDQIEDLKVVEAKVGMQQAIIERLQARIENLNYQINHGGAIKNRSITMEDILKLEGKIKTKEPTFKELDGVEGENNV